MMAGKKRKAQVWILHIADDGALWCLLLQTNRKRGEFWQPVTGSVETGEEFAEGAWREAVEETQLQFAGKPLDTGYSFEFKSARGDLVEERVFMVLVAERAEPVLDPSEHQAYRWVPAGEAEPLIHFQSNAQGLKRSIEALPKEL